MMIILVVLGIVYFVVPCVGIVVWVKILQKDGDLSFREGIVECWEDIKDIYSVYSEQSDDNKKFIKFLYLIYPIILFLMPLCLYIESVLGAVFNYLKELILKKINH